jgi:hypothetical protein
MNRRVRNRQCHSGPTLCIIFSWEKKMRKETTKNYKSLDNSRLSSFYPLRAVSTLGYRNSHFLSTVRSAPLDTSTTLQGSPKIITQESLPWRVGHGLLLSIPASPFLSSFTKEKECDSRWKEDVSMGGYKRSFHGRRFFEYSSIL